ncbi:MAG TPA: hypothetical protein VMO47_10255, partial [Rhodothermales bacterium]|nr:hypothetical protein [Rhodothermales bacterium]
AVVRLDFGATVDTLDRVAVGPQTTYESGTAIGWTEPPSGLFYRPRLERSRDSMLLDGVSGATFILRADLPPGKWWMTVYLEAGLEDSSTTGIAVNGVGIDPDWQAFYPPAEGRRGIQLIYRVLHRPVYVHNEGLNVRFSAGRDSVRLLAMTLHPDPDTGETDPDLMRRLADLGHWDALVYDPSQHAGTVFETIWAATDPLVALRDELSAKLVSDPLDHVTAYWIEQLDILIKAERYFAMRGWEWAKKETGLGLFDRLSQAVMLLDGLLDRPDVATYPLRERALFTRGRLLYWLAEERGGREERVGAQADLSWLLERHPDEPLLRMYNGQRVETPDGCRPASMGSTEAPLAPAWSLTQRTALCSMRQIAAWWTLRQQAENGELGGKLGDDVEILRWWPPLILSGDTVAMQGWRRLADGVWNSDQISDGYAADVSDVEHSSEFISDTAPFMALADDDPEYVARLRPSYQHFRDLWTGMSDHGRRFFRSAWFSSSEVETDPPKNRDVEYNARATKAVRYLAWLTRDSDVIDKLHEWSRAWVSAAMRTDKGKPEGIIPASVRFPDEAINGDEPNWYEANMFWDYFDWTHSSGAKILDQLLFTYTLTADASLLEPMLLSLDMVRDYVARSDSISSTPTRGTRDWAASLLVQESMFWSVVSQWRMFSGDPRYDDLIEQFGTPYVRYRLTGDAGALLSVLEDLNETLQSNTPLRTYEAIHTDRVYLNEGGWPAEFELQAMLTGDGMPEGLSPYHAVTWPTGGQGFTAFVTDSGPERLRVLLHSHDAGATGVTARLWQLDSGTYELVWSDGERTVERTIDVVGAGQAVTLELVPDRTITVRFDRVAN